jgi:hypothetical protein
MAAQRFRLAVRTVLVTFRQSLRDAPRPLVRPLRARALTLLLDLASSASSSEERAILDDALSTVRREGQSSEGEVEIGSPARRASATGALQDRSRVER